jgi:hypothetical protein
MKKHNVSETGSVSVLRWGKTPTLLGPLERANLNHWSSICNVYWWLWKTKQKELSDAIFQKEREAPQEYTAVNFRTATLTTPA